MRLLADTHVLVRWLVDERRLSAAQRRALKRVGAENPLLICDVTWLEIAILVEADRLRLPVPLREWLEQVCTSPRIEQVHLSPAVAAEVAVLPRTFHRDPADRAIVAAARVHRATLLTSDAAIVDAGVVDTID